MHPKRQSCGSAFCIEVSANPLVTGCLDSAVNPSKKCAQALALAASLFAPGVSFGHGDMTPVRCDGHGDMTPVRCDE